MIGKAIALATALAVAAAGTSGCGSGSGGTETKQTLHATFTSFPDSLDPALSFSAEGWTALQNTYIPLLTYAHANGSGGTKVIPGLARTMPTISDDGRTYTLFLRPGLRYSDGTPVRASDFAYAVRRLFELNSPGSPFYTDIVGAEKFAETMKGGIPGIKVNEKTGEIVIELENPRGTFNNELALMFVAPIPQKTPDEDQSANPIPASGPYYLTKSEPGRGWEYERNPYWAKDNGKQLTEIPSGHVDKIEIEVLRNQSTQVNDVESGRLNWIFDPPPTDRYQEVKEKFEGTQFRIEPTISTYYFWMNSTVEPFNNQKVREAVNYAVDPAALERIYTGQIQGTQQILPPGMPGYEKLELFPHDVKKAKELIAESGVKDKEVTVWTDTESPNNDAGTYYQGVLNEIGLKAELKILNADNYFTVIGNTSTPNLDTGFSDWFEDYPHPNDFMFLLNGENIQSTNNQNFSQTNNEALNKKINKLAEEQLGPQQEKEYAELDKAFMEEAAWAPYGTRTLSLFVSENVNLETAIWNPTFETELTSLEFKE